MTRWQRTLYILVFAQLMSAVGMSSIFPFLPLYVEELGSSAGLSVETLAGLVFSVQAFVMMLAAPVWGALADRRGRKLMVERATLGGAVLIALMGFVRSGEELLVLRAVQGAVTGIMSALTALVAANVPRERMGYALGLLQVGLWGGLSLGPLVGGVLADELGFRAAFLVTAGLLALSGGLVWWGVDEQFKPAASHISGQRRGFVAAWRHVLGMPGVPLTYSARFLNQLGRAMLIPFVPLFVAELMSGEAGVATMTGVITGVSAFAGTLSAVYLGRLGDRVGHRRILIGMAGLACLFYLPQSMVNSVWQLLALQIMTGFAAGGITPSLSALLAEFTEPGEEGAVYGLESSIMSGGRALAPLVGAALAGWFSLRSLYAVTGLIFLGMALIALRGLPGAQSLPPENVPAPGNRTRTSVRGGV